MNETELIEYFKKIRQDFSCLHQKINNHNLIYVDNGASTQKPQIMMNRENVATAPIGYTEKENIPRYERG